MFPSSCRTSRSFADERGRNGLFVLTGSEQFRLSAAISQSLAGRTALLHLLPFSLAERRRTAASEAIDDIIYSARHVGEQRFCQCKRAATLSVPPLPSEDAAAPVWRPGTPLARM